MQGARHALPLLPVINPPKGGLRHVVFYMGVLHTPYRLNLPADLLQRPDNPKYFISIYNNFVLLLRSYLERD
jgi:hypothetical protein